MQTFLPYQTFTKSLSCLDNKRLGKQRVEAMQILNALETGSNSRWRNHPAVKMWASYEDLLKAYHDLAIAIWVNRGFKNTMNYKLNACRMMQILTIKKPAWLTEQFCSAHRSNLLRKDFAFYSKYGWTEQPDQEYIWPTKQTELQPSSELQP